MFFSATGHDACDPLSQRAGGVSAASGTSSEQQCQSPTDAFVGRFERESRDIVRLNWEREGRYELE